MVLASFPIENLPKELQIAIYFFALENEARTRRVVVWDDRVMLLPNLASPLLRVNTMARQITKEFYPLRIAVHEIPKTIISAHPLLSLDRAHFMAMWKTAILQTPGAQFVDGNSNLISYDEPAGLSPVPRRLVIDLDQAWVDVQSDYLAGNARRKLKRLQQHATVPHGAIYLNPDRDTILYGYNCGPSFYNNHSGSIDGTHHLAWRHFSDKLPASFYPSDDGDDVLEYFRKTQRSLIVVQPRAVCPMTLLPSVRSRLFHGEVCGRDEIAGEYGFQASETVCRTLELSEAEGVELMARLAEAPRRLPGKMVVWSCYHVSVPQPANADGDVVRYQPLCKSVRAIQEALRLVDKTCTEKNVLLRRCIQKGVFEYQRGQLEDAIRDLCDHQRQLEKALHNCKCFARWKTI